MSLLFTTGWGALYLVVLLLTMVPSLFSRERRWLAMYMFVLFVCDRGAVLALSHLDNATALYFLAWAYMVVAVGVVLTHTAVLMGICLVLTSLAFIAGGFGLLDWEWTGTIQEVLGYIVMFSIVLRKGGGSKRHVSVDGRPRDRGRSAAQPARVAQRQDRR